MGHNSIKHNVQTRRDYNLNSTNFRLRHWSAFVSRTCHLPGISHIQLTSLSFYFYKNLAEINKMEEKKLLIRTVPTSGEDVSLRGSHPQTELRGLSVQLEDNSNLHYLYNKSHKKCIYYLYIIYNMRWLRTYLEKGPLQLQYMLTW